MLMLGESGDVVKGLSSLTCFYESNWFCSEYYEIF